VDHLGDEVALLEQARVLDRNRRLIRQGRQGIDIVLGPAGIVPLIDGFDNADHLVVDLHGHR